MVKSSLPDRRLAETPEPFRSGVRPLAASMRDAFVTDNASGKPPVVTFVDRIKVMWPTLRITDNIKAVAGMVVAEALAPDYVPGRRKTAPRGSCMASGTLFIPASTSNLTTDLQISSLEDDGTFELARETLERAAETFASIKAGKPFDQRRRDHLRLAISALQMANAEPV
jgi:hypothetical protein